LVLVGSPGDRARLRARLPADVEVVGEAGTVDAARRAGLDVDGILIAPRANDDVDGGTDDLIEPLTDRELDVLALLADGLSNKSIASELRISDQTVKFHVASICGKLSVANRTEAVRQAIRRGLVPL
jgi:ATP/maltotriose-dependent transcriptional regulator MalT